LTFSIYLSDFCKQPSKGGNSYLSLNSRELGMVGPIKKIPVKELIDRLVGMSQALSDEVVREFGSLSLSQLNWKPSDKSWSISQCLAHLNAFYRYYIPVFNGKISNTRFTTPSTHFMSSPLGYAVSVSIRLGKLKNVKRKLKSAKDYNPVINKSLPTENAYNEYLDHQRSFIDTIIAATRINLRKAKCPLSVRPVVKLNIGDSLIYLVYHNERHVEQAKRVKRLPNFPAV